MTPVEKMDRTVPDWRIWLLGVLVTISIMLAGFVYSALTARIEAMATQMPKLGERVAATEATQAALQRQLDNDIRELREGVKTLGTKLDRLIETRSR